MGWDDTCTVHTGILGGGNHHSSGSNSGGGGSSSSSRYTYMDEEYLRCLQSQMHWDRDNGIIHLMPIAVVYQEDVY